MRKYREYTDDDVIKFAKEVKNLSQLLKKLNLQSAGGNYSHIKKTIQRLNIDCSHWGSPKDRQAHSRGKQLKDWSQYSRVAKLKPHLLKLRGHQCENCKNTEWMGFPITLEVDHVDGDKTNNCLDNLKLLCCNCHALTPTWRGRKRKKQ
jgi:hypothetical protein